MVGLLDIDVIALSVLKRDVDSIVTKFEFELGDASGGQRKRALGERAGGAGTATGRAVLAVVSFGQEALCAPCAGRAARAIKQQQQQQQQKTCRLPTPLLCPVVVSSCCVLF